MDSTHNTGHLDILHCPGCNAAVPLGDRDDVVCLYCNTSFPLPDKHRALRDAERRKTSEREEARALYATLGRPPGVLARLWGEVAVGCVWLVLWPVAFVASGLLIAKALEVLSRSLHATLYDTLPNTVVWAGIGVALYATLAVPVVLGVYGKRRTNARQRIQAALASLPADRSGGPARCRSCGAPLDVVAGALGVACVYCGADNLVRMPEAWVAKLRERTAGLDVDIETAARTDREMRSGERRSLARQLSWLLVFIPVMTLFGVAFDRDADAFPPNYRRAIAADRQLIPASRPDDGPYDKFVPPTIAANGVQVRFAYDKSEKGDGYCMRSYLVPLRYGETVTLVAGDFPWGARALGISFSTQVSAVFGDDWRQEGRSVYLYPHGTVTYVAPRSAWYRVDVLMIDDVAPGKQFEIAVSVAPPNP